MISFRALISSLLIICSSNAWAQCDFREANYAKELARPDSITKINIDVVDSRKFSINFARILVSKSEYIRPKFKKKFDARITVHYRFGSCEMHGTVRQTGDLRDHIVLTPDGKQLQSLAVTLDHGNVVNAVQFKLFLPKTRNDAHEVLGALILRKLGFIAPETFQVTTVVNGVSNMMIFQEHTRKEMIERNKRRDGPLFEGDESLIWGIDRIDSVENTRLSLSRVLNKNWLLKGKNHKSIALSSYVRLQVSLIWTTA